MEWIELEVEKPKENDTILTYGYYLNGGFGVMQCTHSNGIFRFMDSEREHKGNITHWMPLPETPKE